MTAMTKQALHAVLTVAVLTGVMAIPATAIDLGGHDRDGVVVGFNFGAGWNSYTFDIPDFQETTTDNILDFTGAVSVGWARNEYFLASVGISGWREDFWVAGVPFSTRNFHILADLCWFPRGEGFWLKGGLGLGDLDFTVVAPAERYAIKKTGWTFVGGAGYEFRVSGGTALGVSYDARYLTIGEFDQFGPTTSLTHALTLNIRYYTDG